jgi:hypothetical protein
MLCQRVIASEGENNMRVMVIIKSDESAEAGNLPDAKFLAEMGQYNDELVKAGVMLMGEGLHPSSKGAKVKFTGRKAQVVDGPFAEAKELIAGFWIWQVKSLDEAIEWVKRMPVPAYITEAHTGEIEIRQVFENAEFGDELNAEVKAQEMQLKNAAKK